MDSNNQEPPLRTYEIIFKGNDTFEDKILYSTRFGLGMACQHAYSILPKFNGVTIEQVRIFSIIELV